MNKFFYEKNRYVLDHEVNKTFEQVMWMTDEEFKGWMIEMRKVVAYAWDELGLPPRVGFDEEEIINQFNQMSNFPVHEFEVLNEFNNEKDVIRNTSVIGNAANQWFPTMMKTRINYSSKDDGRSIYDHFVDDSLLDKVLKYGSRHFKRDSFYHYSAPIKTGQVVQVGTQTHHVKDAESFIHWFEENARQYETHDYWIDQKKDEDSEYTGYNEDLKNVKWIQITKEQIESLPIPEKCLRNLSVNRPAGSYQIRFYEYGQKLFPVGFKAFRISWCQYAVNFPPLTAKYLYERFTNHIKGQEQINIWDPSSGWGGRILGAMAVKDDRHIHYIGCDPNTDHQIEDEIGQKSKYENLANFFNTKTYRGNSFFGDGTNTYEFHFSGSEEMQHIPEFKKYKGKLDMVFTSPPYFAKEAYSDDPTQSYKKFGQYQEWVNGFLRPTLETAVAWLASDRYLLWNIADAKFGPDILPLEKDSCDILKELGMEYVTTLKMSLAQMPGGNRVDSETGLPKAKNFCKVNGIWLKYEPIFVFRKP